MKISGKCPKCSARMVEKYRPFCSKRCADIDLGKWLGESYRIQTNEPAPMQFETDDE